MVAPARSRTLTYGDHVDEMDNFHSSSIASRVADLHAAFADPAVRGILTVIGGFKSNELLPHLDWELIARKPKMFCGYSDITALQNAILARSGLITYSAFFRSAPEVVPTVTSRPPGRSEFGWHLADSSHFSEPWRTPETYDGVLFVRDSTPTHPTPNARRAITNRERF